MRFCLIIPKLDVTRFAASKSHSFVKRKKAKIRRCYSIGTDIANKQRGIAILCASMLELENEQKKNGLWLRELMITDNPTLPQYTYVPL